MPALKRDALCPCGSGASFSMCHGAASADRHEGPASESDEAIRLCFQRLAAHEHQREAIEGRGRPIISEEVGGWRFVAVGGELLSSRHWKTFHDFLMSYIEKRLGSEWIDSEVCKPCNEQHPIVRWRERVLSLNRDLGNSEKDITSAPMTTAIAAYLKLSYDLFTIAHNAEVSRRLLGRLRHRDQFDGAYYEVCVAAALIRAGFELSFENEDDRSTTHCEFSAMHAKSNAMYSVEAKHRAPPDGPGSGGDDFKLARRLTKALKKKARHTRIVFVDMNVPMLTEGDTIPEHLHRELKRLRKHEKRATELGLPPAYVLITNSPHVRAPDDPDASGSVLLEGFCIPDCKHDARFASVRAAVASRDAHRPLFDLFDSIRLHRFVPDTFSGVLAEFEREQSEPRLLIGERYVVPDGKGNDVPGTLTSATVDEAHGVTMGVYRLDDGRSVIVSCPLTDAEVRAYRQCPDTFFGVLVPSGSRRHGDTDVVALYDFFFDTYRHSTRERLVEFLLGHAPLPELRQMSQEDLAKRYAELCAEASVRRQRPADAVHSIRNTS